MDIFGIPIETTKDLLNLSLSGGFLLIVLFLCLVLIRLYVVLGNLANITESIAEITDVIRHYVWKPIELINTLISKITSLFNKRR
ncbi:MAG: hypothetical protein N4A36_03460 [Candidatus Gracilibacteria bacterium]|nr:hypothetical protein [Candidatus Gracilibacteria bacterium]